MVTGQLMFNTKKIFTSQISTFSWLVSLVEQRTDISLGGRGVYPRKNCLNGFARTGTTAQNESGGQLAPLALPWRRHWKWATQADELNDSNDNFDVGQSFNNGFKPLP